MFAPFPFIIALQYYFIPFIMIFQQHKYNILQFSFILFNNIVCFCNMVSYDSTDTLPVLLSCSMLCSPDLVSAYLFLPLHNPYCLTFLSTQFAVVLQTRSLFFQLTNPYMSLKKKITKFTTTGI